MQVNLPFIDNIGKEGALQALRDSRCTRLLVSYPTGWKKHPETNQIGLPRLKETVAWFRENGMEEVGVWLFDFWGSGIGDEVQHMVSADGRPFDPVCPLDTDYRKIYAEQLVKLAGCGVDTILLDDDYRLTFQMEGAKNFGCTCPLHVRRIGEIIGREITREELQTALLTGGENEIRTAWLQANKEGMEGFARDMRAALDANGFENTRMGACTCPGNWDMDGTDPVTLAKTLAGKNRPLFRYSGAPYWAEHHSFNGFWLQDVIEFNRMQAAWFGSDEWDNFFEGDLYPRPRHNGPTIFMEAVTTALIADGNSGGAFKYMLDYVGPTSYEHGYVSRHVKNLPFYDELEKTFVPKENDGVRIYETMKKYAKTVIPKRMEGKTHIQEQTFSYASRLLAQAGIPTTYEGTGCVGICFGENARELPPEALEHGMILDAEAAEILTSRGVDVGLIAAYEKQHAYTETFLTDPPLMIRHSSNGLSYRRADLKEGVTIRSTVSKTLYGEFPGIEKNPYTYTYENADGQRFLVYLWDDTFGEPRAHRNYMRGKQIADLVPWLSRGKRKLPAYVFGNPDFYVMAKTDEKSMAVGMWNLFADETDTLTVELEETYSHIRFLRGKGTLEGNRVIVEPMAAYSIAAFEVTK